MIQLKIVISLSCCRISFQQACGNCCKHQDLGDGAEPPGKHTGLGLNRHLTLLTEHIIKHIPTLQSVQIINLPQFCCKRGALLFCHVSCKEEVKNLSLKIHPVFKS